jgi:hypothetical protein
LRVEKEKKDLVEKEIQEKKDVEAKAEAQRLQD